MTNLNQPVLSPSQKESPIYIRSEAESRSKKVRFEDREDSSPFGVSQTKSQFQPVIPLPTLGIGNSGTFPQPQISFRHRSSNSQLTADENQYFRQLLNPVGISDLQGSPRYIEDAKQASKERINEVLNDIGLQLKLERELDSLKSKMNEFMVTDSTKKIPKEDSSLKKVSVLKKGQFSLEAVENTENLPAHTSEVSCSRTKEP
mmetsp:Transcript_22792/g.35091  ORF Transcript_22792/g.35091 Transcript_22792/m.35091 type:complete len:203 (-) Transcript_22792:2640-3248(-)